MGEGSCLHDTSDDVITLLVMFASALYTYVHSFCVHLRFIRVFILL